ncbi:MAG: hypothetical protein U1E45_19090 [Geminicoccaceae bacterium]
MDEDDRVRHRLEKQLDQLHLATRAFDTKAQIASVGYLLTLGVMRLGFEWRPGGWSWPGPLAAATALLVVALPVALFTFVLVPQRRYRLAALPTHREAPRTLTGSWFEGRTAAEIAAEAASVDWTRELAFEIEKVCLVRDTKRRRFMLALAACAVTIVTMLIRLALA